MSLCFDNTFQRSIGCSIQLKTDKKNFVLPAFKIWIPGGMNDVNYDADRSKDIHTRFQADKYMDKRYRAFRVLGEKVFLKKRSRLEHVYFY